MAQVKISQLPTTATLNSADTLMIVQNGVNSKITTNNFFNQIPGPLTTEHKLTINDHLYTEKLVVSDTIDTIDTSLIAHIDGSVLINSLNLKSEDIIIPTSGDTLFSLDENINVTNIKSTTGSLSTYSNISLNSPNNGNIFKIITYSGDNSNTITYKIAITNLKHSGDPSPLGIKFNHSSGNLSANTTGAAILYSIGTNWVILSTYGNCSTYSA